MSSRYAQTARDQRTHIPAHIEQAMTQHMQQSMPAHLKKYVGSGHGYIPQHAERQIAQQMQKTMPAHLKQYAGAYMQQNIIQPNSARPVVTPSPRTTPHAPLPDKLRRGHSMPYGEQHTVELNTLPNDQSLFRADQPQLAAPAAPPSGPYHPSYDFIMNPGGQPPKQPWLPGGASTAMRALMVAGLALVLLVAFVIIKNLVAGSPKLDAFVGIAQDQQELIHLVVNANNQQDLSSDNQNFVATALLSLRSSQSDLISYLSKSHQKVTVKQLNLKINNATDEQLAFAAAGGTYNTTFQEVMRARLDLYMSDLGQTFNSAKGPQGRMLLNDQYAQAKLLEKQLGGSSTGN